MTHTISQIRTIFWLALGGVSALFGAENWSSFETILLSRYNVWELGIERYYASPGSNSVPYICTGILYYYVPDVGVTPVGGFDICNGVLVSSYFLYFGEAYTANTGEGTKPDNSGYWEVYYDYNGEGVLGTQSEGVISNNAKLVDPNKYSISNFTPCGQTSATFEFHITDPTVVLPFGSIAVNRAGANNLISLSVSTTGTLAGGLTFQYKNALTNTAWTLHSTHAIPTQGALVSTVDTNTVPSRFYRAIAPK